MSVIIDTLKLEILDYCKTHGCDNIELCLTTADQHFNVMLKDYAGLSEVEDAEELVDLLLYDMGVHDEIHLCMWCDDIENTFEVCI